MAESLEIRTMRYLAWERAKGELKGILMTYNPDHIPFSEPNRTTNYDRMSDLVERFIKEVEDDGLVE